LVAYLELVRLPNVFTSVADVMMGFLFTHAVFERGEGWVFGLLIAGSSCFYAAGTVLNDLFDLETDRRERPDRPLPSGRISPAAARWFGWGLLALGLASAWAVVLLAADLRAGVVGSLLASCILLYDAVLKRTPVGPLAMGGCRTLNVLLGMSVSASPWQNEHWLVAAAIGTYVVGVTWFARTEARTSSRRQLALATTVILGGIAMLGLLPRLSGQTVPLLRSQPERWTLLIVLLGGLIGIRCLRAVIEPLPYRVQMVVKQCILSLVLLNAAACLVVRGLPGALVILSLLVPAMVLGQWIRST